MGSLATLQLGILIALLFQRQLWKPRAVGKGMPLHVELWLFAVVLILAAGVAIAAAAQAGGTSKLHAWQTATVMTAISWGMLSLIAEAVLDQREAVWKALELKVSTRVYRNFKRAAAIVGAVYPFAVAAVVLAFAR